MACMVRLQACVARAVLEWWVDVSVASTKSCNRGAGSGGTLPLTSLGRGEGCKPEQVGCRDGGRRRLRAIVLLQHGRWSQMSVCAALSGKVLSKSASKVAQ